MLLTTLGTPSAFTVWGTLLLRTLVQVTRGKFQYIAAVTFDDLQTAFAARTNDQVIIYSDAPDERMSNLLKRVGAPAAVFTEEPVDVVGYVMKTRNIDARKAIRFSCRSYTCLSAFHGQPFVSWFSRRTSSTVGHMLKQLASHYKIELEEDDAERVLSRVVRGYRKGDDPSVESIIQTQVPEAKPLGQMASELDVLDRDIAESLLRPYLELTHGRPLTSVMWPKQLFYEGNNTGAYVSGPIELAGRARFLFWAPNLHLPLGHWSATVHINISESYSRNTVLVDVKCGEVLSSGRIDLPDRGSFIFTLQFAITDSRLPIEIRFFLEKGAIEGWIDLVSVMIERDRAEAA